MEKQYTFFDLIVDVFKETKNPMSADEVWEKAIELGLDKKLGSLGKTPSATVGARLYVDAKENGEKSTFVQVSKRPSRFLLRSLNLNVQQIENEIEKKDEIEIKKYKESNFNERDLHPLLVKYVKDNPHFHCFAKTIYQENSVRKIKGANEYFTGSGVTVSDRAGIGSNEFALTNNDCKFNVEQINRTYPGTCHIVRLETDDTGMFILKK